MLHPPAISSCLEVEGGFPVVTACRTATPGGLRRSSPVQPQSEEMKVRERVLLKPVGFKKIKFSLFSLLKLYQKKASGEGTCQTGISNCWSSGSELQGLCRLEVNVWGHLHYFCTPAGSDAL